MELLPWSHTCSTGITLRGWYSPPSGKPLLHFVHGNGYCCLAYEPMLQVLARDFDLWLCDAQGHGDSDEGEHFLGWNRNAEMVQECFTVASGRFGDVPRYASGHSFGGVLTCLIMAGSPHLFDRAVLLDPVLFTPKAIISQRLRTLLRLDRRQALVAKTRRRRDLWPDRDAAYLALHERGMFRGWDDAAFAAYIRYALKDVAEGVQLKCSPARTEAEVFRRGPDHLWSSLHRITTPVEVIYGEQTLPNVRQSVPRWCAINAHVRAQIVPGGHCFMQERPLDAAIRLKAALLPE